MRTAHTFGLIVALAAAAAPDDVRVEVACAPPTIPLSGTAAVTVTVEGAAPLEVECPDAFLGPADVWAVVKAGEPEVTKLSRDRERWRRTFQVEPRTTGTVALQVAPFRYRTAKAEDWREYTCPSIKIQVTTSVEEPSLKALRDITGVEPVPPAPDGRPTVAIAVGAVVVACLLVFTFRRRRAPAPRSEPTPAEWAQHELDQVAGLDLLAAGAVERFHVRVSQVLRQYLERRFGLKATEQTTPEFLDGLRGSALLGAEQQQLLGDFLRQCDLAKFARAEYSPAECAALMDTARAFVQDEQRRAANVTR